MKRPLKNSQNRKILMTNDSLMKVESITPVLSDNIGLENQYSVFLRATVLHMFNLVNRLAPVHKTIFHQCVIS